MTPFKFAEAAQPIVCVPKPLKSNRGIYYGLMVKKRNPEADWYYGHRYNVIGSEFLTFFAAVVKQTPQLLREHGRH